MDVDTGEIHRLNADEVVDMKRLTDHSERFVDLKRKMVSLSDAEATELEHQSPRKRKSWMRNQPCVCGSEKKFKKCCWSKFR